MSLDAREPPGGDFVAYIEQLERAQVARQSVPGTMVAPPSAGATARLTASQAEAVAAALLQTPGPSGHARSPTKPAPKFGASQQPTALSAEQAQQLLARLNAGGQAGPSLVAIVVGIGLIIGGGAMNAGPVPFFLGVAAIVWGARRLERLKKSKP
ncbi:MAG: hypothetical protein ACM3ZD_05195 [Betaproteobacteria bacterium]